MEDQTKKLVALCSRLYFPLFIYARGVMYGLWEHVSEEATQ